MINNIKDKIRALVEDLGEVQYEVFTGTTRKLSESSIPSIEKVYINGNETEDYEYNDILSEITIIQTGHTDEDINRVEYLFYNYSDNELLGYISAALSWISIFSDCTYELDSGETIIPQPDSQSKNLIAIIASILIKPNYSRYSSTTITVHYPRNLSKEEKIEKIVKKFTEGIGVNTIVDLTF